MKNNILKFYIAATYFFSTIVMFAQDPGTDTDSGPGLESTDPAAPIDDYIWVLAAIGLFFVYMKFRAMHKKSIQN